MVPCAEASEKFFTAEVLVSPRAAATVLRGATELEFPSEDVMVDIGASATRMYTWYGGIIRRLTPSAPRSARAVGRCINTVAKQFEVIDECSALPADCFSCIVRTAREMGTDQDVLEAGVQRFCTDRLPASRDASLSDGRSPLEPSEFEEVRCGVVWAQCSRGRGSSHSTAVCEQVVAAPGKTSNPEHCAALFDLLDRVLAAADLDYVKVERLCLSLHALGLWTQLPHAQIGTCGANHSVAQWA